LANFRHELLKLDVELDLQAVVGHQLQTLLDERENRDLFIRVQSAVFIGVEYAHEVLDGTYPGQTVQVRLVLPKHHLQHLLCKIGSGHIVLSKRAPDGLALLGSILIGLGLSLDLGNDCRVEGVEGIERLRVQLDGRDGIAAVRSNL
jgi:hypothetical protein